MKMNGRQVQYVRNQNSMGVLLINTPSERGGELLTWEEICKISSDTVNSINYESHLAQVRYAGVEGD